MNATLRAKINNALQMHGLGRLDDPGLPAQLGYLVRDHDHFRELLSVCEPQHRTAMYNSLTPYLRFDAKPLDVYLYENADQADREQLPTVAEDGTLEPYRVPELHSAVQTLIEDAVAKGWLEITCRKCTKQAFFAGSDRQDAVRKAREAGWVYREDEAGEGFETCEECA